jgi:hypothetical protein
MKATFMTVLTFGIAGGVAGCASGPAPPPTVQVGPTAEVTVDGLHKVDNSVLPLAYVKPDLALQQYTKLMLDPVSVAYQKEPRSRSGGIAAQEQNYALSTTQMNNLKSWFSEAVVNALTADDGYEIVDTPGPDVLRVTAELIDLVVRFPTERGGRQQTFTRSYGEVTLVVELRDSESGEILARVADRRDPTRNTDVRLAQVSPTFVKSDTVRLFGYWANLLRERLDFVRTM